MYNQIMKARTDKQHPPLWQVLLLSLLEQALERNISVHRLPILIPIKGCTVQEGSGSALRRKRNIHLEDVSNNLTGQYPLLSFHFDFI